jgi:hypothetical protein
MGNPVDAITRIFTCGEGASTLITTYVTTNHMLVSGDRNDIPCMSTTSDADNTLGQNPVWQ